MFDKTQSSNTLKLGSITFTVKHDYTLGWSLKATEEQWPFTGGLIIQTAEDEFMIAGTGIVVSFSVDQSNVGILNIEEGSYINGQWTPRRRMNGGQSHQGRHLCFPVGEYGIQKLRLYKYK